VDAWKEDSYGPVRIVRNDLFVLYGYAGFGGADLGAIAAVGALVRVDYVFGIAGGDGVLGAFRQTGVAQNTIVGDLVSQIRASFFFSSSGFRSGVPSTEIIGKKENPLALNLPH
jgi:hypothetical protein